MRRLLFSIIFLSKQLGHIKLDVCKIGEVFDKITADGRYVTTLVIHEGKIKTGGNHSTVISRVHVPLCLSSLLLLKLKHIF